MGWSCAPSSLLRSDLAADLEGLRRFEEEARAAARISHPAVVTVFDSGEHDGTAYLVMECLPGRSLADEIAQGPLLAARVRHLAEELLGALASAHEVGVIHRDIKPSNVLLADDGSPKLADFGIAKTLDAGDHTRTGMVIGTVAYLAPERLAGERATPASDLYSLGVVLYEALTGDKRFPGDTPVAVAHAISTQHPVPVERRVPGVAVDPVLAEVVDRVLSRDPSQRYASAADMRAALTSADANATRPVKATAAYEIPPPAEASTTATGRLIGDLSRASARRRRTPPGAAVAVAAVVAALAVLVFVALRAYDDPSSSPEDTPPSTQAPSAGAPLPASLEDAIRQLETAVDP